MAPTMVGTIDDITLTAGEMSDAMDVSGYFSDADEGDTLSYAAMSSDEAVATAAVSGSMVTVSAMSAGEATITVTATDMGGLSVDQTFMVTVEPVALAGAGERASQPGGKRHSARVLGFRAWRDRIHAHCGQPGQL